MRREAELLRMHVEALFVHDADSRLLRVNDAGGAPASRFFLGRTRTGNLWRFRDDVPDELVVELEALCRDEPVEDDPPPGPRHDKAYRELLAPVEHSALGPAFHFADPGFASTRALRVTRHNADVLRGVLDDWLPDVAECQPFFVAIEDGRAVSVCASVRITPEAHEAGVDTAPAYRGRGLALEVVRAWAQAVVSIGATPLYSTSWENTASRRVAGKLGLSRYGSTFHLT